MIEDFSNTLVTATPFLLGSLWFTITISAMSIVIGTAIGLLLGLASAYGGWVTRFLVRIYVDIVRGIPGLVKIFTVFYLVNALLSEVAGFTLSAMACGVVALSIHASAQVSEMARGAIQALSKGQAEAGKAIGLRFWQVQFYVIYPQAIRQILPTWVTSSTEIVKGTTLLSLISVPEFFITIRELAAREFLYIQFYGFAMIVYFLLNFSIELLGAHLERRYSRY
ncbi:amino acid ABC transporter permease [Oceaniovalibus sp. ACAM 378]|uniref:amino acid ABC transporter permease n=1 Tax=Oceaniovalibus sp. ACAM 378 TaxID=2599923 RepID=UPI0011DC2055|nr:amino acid ABC transporter permease [Oceaniovalibus sp. ACAM 378]TYB84310.1 amino acid ABC transporter permease [Oceaniovalibus sp. ACAM 378]